MAVRVRPHCQAPDCPNYAVSKGYCPMHWHRVQRFGEPGPAGRLIRRRTPIGACELQGCENRRYARGYCLMHYSRFLKFGEPGPAEPSKKRRAKEGEGHQTVQGYRWIRAPHHPNATKNGYIFEHRLVMSRALGRPLYPEEAVHHRNGDRGDNRPENLEIWLQGHPSGQRIEDAVAWARTVLIRYASDLFAQEAI